MSKSPSRALEAINISKRFGEFVALDKVSLRLDRGSIHALLGENGAGKSTLVKCVMGYYHPDEGEVIIGEREEKITNPKQAHALGIGMVYQHFTLIPNMTVAENLVLARARLPGVINWRAEIEALKLRMENMPFQVPLEASVNSLSAGEKQKVEIIKQLMLDSSILILDEPTSVLTPNEADEVLGQIRKMVREANLSVLMITHKFREVMTYADDVTVLRKGHYIGTRKVTDVSTKQLAEMMVGSEVHAIRLEREALQKGEVILAVQNLQVADDTGCPAVSDLSFRIQGGEILGIAGVSGNGQSELVEVLAGQREAEGGEIRVHGEIYHATRDQIRRHHMHCLPEEPLKNACVPRMSVAENLVFRRFDRPPLAFRNWLLNRRAIRSSARELIKRFSIRTSGPDNPIGNLSGGNVQRTVLARELSSEVELLVIANPCFGLDFGAVADIHALIMSARNRGAAVLLVSEDLDEILELSDRLSVISGGKLVYETTPQQADLSTIGQYMAGH